MTCQKLNQSMIHKLFSINLIGSKSKRWIPELEKE